MKHRHGHEQKHKDTIKLKNIMGHNNISVCVCL